MDHLWYKDAVFYELHVKGYSDGNADPGTITPAKDPLAPTNTSPMNSGVQQLPPVKSAVLWYAAGAVTATTLPTNVAIGGDVYLYDRNLKSAVKFPPHFHHVWLMMQSVNNSNTVYGIGVDSATVNVTGIPQRLDNGVLSLNTSPANVRRAVQASYGPDGALYFLNYGGGDYANTANSGVLRVAYTGSCHLAPVSVRPDYRTNPAGLAVQMRRDGIFIRESGAHALQLHDLAGSLMASRNGSGSAHYSYVALRDGARLEPGVYVVSIRTAKGSFVRQVSLF
jgi:hypothetical protein